MVFVIVLLSLELRKVKEVIDQKQIPKTYHV